MAWNEQLHRYEYPGNQQPTDWQYGVDTPGAIVGIGFFAVAAIFDRTAREVMIEVTGEELARTKPVQRIVADWRRVSAKVASVALSLGD